MKRNEFRRSRNVAKKLSSDRDKKNRDFVTKLSADRGRKPSKFKFNNKKTSFRQV